MRATLPRILAIVLAMAPALVALGQNELPEGLTTRTNLSQSEEQSVTDWALANWAQVDAQTPEAARDARRRLVQPLLATQTSASFRVAMDQALSDQFRQAMLGDDVFRGVNAALLMGWLATDRSVRALTEAAQGDQIALRFASVSGLSNAFQAAGFAPVAFQAQVGNEAVEAVATIMESTDDRSMLDATAKALVEAMDVPESAIAGFGARSGERLTRAMGARLNTLPIDAELGGRVTPLIGAMADVRQAVTQRRGNVGAGWQSAILEMYGRAGALGFRYVRAERAGTLGAADAQAIRRSVRTAIQVAGTIPTLLRVDQATQSRLGQIRLAENFDRSPQDDGDGYQRSATDLFRLMDSQFDLGRERFNIGG